MKILRILLLAITPCCLALCTTGSQALTSLENRALADGKRILDAELTKAERKAGL